MSTIERVDIDGFWGDRLLTLDLHDDVNFVIGVNGSGKTTLVNLIAAALTADFPTLDRLLFKRILISLRGQDRSSRPSIEVKKIAQKKSPYPSIEYLIRDRPGADPIKYSLDALEEERFYRQHIRGPYPFPLQYRRMMVDISDRLRQIAPTTWLSIHRSTGPRPQREEKSFESSVDMKLSEISDSLVRYFSQLQKRASDEINKFQETVFLSLIYEPDEKGLLSAVQDLDIAQEKQSLREIYNQFGVHENRFATRMERYFSFLSETVSKIGENERPVKRPINMQDIVTVMSGLRINSIIK